MQLEVPLSETFVIKNPELEFSRRQGLYVFQRELPLHEL